MSSSRATLRGGCEGLAQVLTFAPPSSDPANLLPGNHVAPRLSFLPRCPGSTGSVQVLLPLPVPWLPRTQQDMGAKGFLRLLLSSPRNSFQVPPQGPGRACLLPMGCELPSCHSLHTVIYSVAFPQSFSSFFFNLAVFFFSAALFFIFFGCTKRHMGS